MSRPRSRFDKKPGTGNDIHHFHLILLIKNEKGYRNLCRLLTQSYLEGFYYRPRIDQELLAAHAEGLIGLSSCLKGEISTWFSRGFAEKAEDAAREYASIFAKGDFFIELQDHGLAEQKAVNPLLVDLARKLDLPLVATNDVHFARREDAESQDVLVCIQTNRKVSDPDRLKFSTDQFYFKSAAEMAALFRDYPEAIQNTGRIAARCEFEFPSRQYFLPNFTPPEGKSLSEYFEEVAWEGFRKRTEKRAARATNGEHAHSDEEYEDRLKREIKLIKQMRFEGYFLIVWDLLKEAREKGHPGRARPRLGGGQPPRLRPGDHRDRPPRVRPPFRTLPQPRADQPAGHRHGLLRPPPRRDDRVRDPEIRPGERLPDHHLRDHGRPGGHP